MPNFKNTIKDAFANLGPYSSWYRDGIDAQDKNGSYAVQRLKNNFFTPEIDNKNITLRAEDKIFTIGSCFARGIEKTLVHRGFNVLSASEKLNGFELVSDKCTALGSTNKYNTYSILNELKWALDPSANFPENSIVNINDDEWIDLNLNPTLKNLDLKGTIERRQIVKEINQGIKECSIIVITLGLTETWYDNWEKIYLNMTPKKSLMEKYPNRYSFEVSNFSENINNLELIHELIKKYGHPDAKIIITVSPVPLMVTFTKSDIVIANTRSKSTLRTAAEEFALNHNDVVYFPSYEIVMNSNKDLAWNDDGRHVNGSLVKHIMDLYINHFLDSKLQNRIGA